MDGMFKPHVQQKPDAFYQTGILQQNPQGAQRPGEKSRFPIQSTGWNYRPQYDHPARESIGPDVSDGQFGTPVNGKIGHPGPEAHFWPNRRTGYTSGAGLGAALHRELPLFPPDLFERQWTAALRTVFGLCG